MLDNAMAFDINNQGGARFSFSDYDNISNHQGDTALWRAVITQALMDAGSNSKKPAMKKAKAIAIEWLSTMSDGFVEVCSYANLPPEYVRKKSIEAIRNGCKWRVVNKNSYTKNRKQKKIRAVTNCGDACLK